nr:hypothetical protein [Tanacetum cinerariifolium]
MMVSKVPGPEDTIKFMLNTQEFIYTVDMFQDILHLHVETLENLFVAPVNIKTIKAFMNRVGYQGVVDKKKAIKYPQFIKLIIADLMKKFLDIPQRIEEYYHSIKDNIPSVSVYTTRNVLVRGMPISDAFLTKEIHAIDDFKEHETVFMNVVVPMNQPQPVVSDQGTHSCWSSKNVAKVQEKLDEEEIEKMVEGDEDEESYASEFANFVLNDDVDDFGTRIELESYNENPKNVDDDVDIEKEKKADVEIENETKDDEEIENDDNVEKIDKVVKEKDIIDDVTGSMEIRKEQKQTLIPSTTRSLRNVSSSDKTISEELTATISPTTTTTSKASTAKHKKRSFSHKTKTLPAWFIGLEDVLSWLWVKGKRDAITVDINAIALFRQAIRSSSGRNDRTASPGSSWGNSACGCEIGGVLHKLVSMVEKNELVEELMIVFVDTE